MSDRVRLHYHDRGHGDPVLLLVHGWGGDLRAWAPCVPGLTDRHRVVVVDLRGHGQSPVPSHGYRPADMADDVVALVERLGIAPVVAVGHSMGAQVVTALAVDHPGTVSALVVVDPAYGANDDEAALVPARLAELRAEGAAGAVRQLGLTGDLAGQMLATPGHVLAEAYAGMYAEPGAFGLRAAAERYLAGRRCPVLALHARAEPARWEASLAAPEASRVVLWDGCGHFLHHERPREFATLVTGWLRELGWYSPEP